MRMALVLILKGIIGAGVFLGLVLVILGPIEIASVLHLLRQLFLTPTTVPCLANVCVACIVHTAVLALEPVNCIRLRLNCCRNCLVILAVDGDGAMKRAFALSVPAIVLMTVGPRRLISTVLKFTERLSRWCLLMLASYVFPVDATVTGRGL